MARRLVPSKVVFVGWSARPRSAGPGSSIAVHTHAYTSLRGCRWDGSKNDREWVLTTDDPAKVWESLVAKLEGLRPLWVFCPAPHHWLTLTGFWDRVERGEWALSSPDEPVKGRRPRPGLITLSGPPYLFFLRHARGQIKVVGLENYFPGPTEQVFRDHGVPEFECTLPLEEGGNLRQYAEYLATGARGIMLPLLNEWRAGGSASWAPTAAGLAAASYRSWGEPSAPIPPPDGDDKSFERRAYYGGRIRVGWVGSIRPADQCTHLHRVSALRAGEYIRPGPVAHLDTRGLFPWIMTRCAVPIRKAGSYHRLPIDELYALTHVMGAAAAVLIDSKDRPYPVKVGDRTVYAVGQFWTFLCGCELFQALKMGDAVKSRRCVLYYLGSPFKGWCEHWMGVRDEAERQGDAGKARLAKLVLNSLYGRFAMKGSGWVHRPGEVAPDAWVTWAETDHASGERRVFQSVGWEVHERIVVPELRHSFPAVSAFITASARMYMDELWETAGPLQALYSHTDSLIVTERGFWNLLAAGCVAPGAWGKLRVDGLADNARIIGSNDYVWNGVRVCGGLPRGEVPPEATAWRIDQWEGIGTIFQQRPDGTVRSRGVIVNLPDDHPGGQVDRRGYVHPFTFLQTDR